MFNLGKLWVTSLLLIICAWFPSQILAQLVVPQLKARVTDLTGTLSQAQNSHLESILQSFENRKGSQVALLIVPSTKPENIEQYALRVAEAWKLGRKGVDDGALLLVAKEDRALRIEVGYGLEGVLTDATSKRIIDEIIVPRFRNGDFYGGLLEGVNSIVRLVDGEQLPEPARTAPFAGDNLAPGLFFVFMATLIVTQLLRPVFGAFGAGFLCSSLMLFMGLLLLPFLLALIMSVVVFALSVFLGAMPASGYRRGYGRGYYGGSSWGGGGGGSFGGFSGGGGSFGGGGASGRW